MMENLIGLSSDLCLLIGSFLCISGGLGILRFPDFYTRMHAAGVTDTLTAIMILVGLMLLSPETIVFIKLVMILLMTLFISPVTSHALAKAAIHNGLMPLLDTNIINKKGNKKEEKIDKGGTKQSNP